MNKKNCVKQSASHLWKALFMWAWDVLLFTQETKTKETHFHWFIKKKKILFFPAESNQIKNMFLSAYVCWQYSYPIYNEI